MGAVGGFFVARLRMPSIVVTLALMVAWRDGLRWLTEGTWVQDLPEKLSVVWAEPNDGRGDCDWRCPGCTR